jgi:hypothetical protein
VTDPGDSGREVVEVGVSLVLRLVRLGSDELARFVRDGVGQGRVTRVGVGRGANIGGRRGGELRRRLVEERAISDDAMKEKGIKTELTMPEECSL